MNALVVNRNADSLTLSNNVVIEVRPASFRGLRGVTTVAVLCDESCFWHSDETSKNADAEILNAVRPTSATTGGPLILISSPYSRQGETWSLYSRHFGQKGDPLILIAQGASRDFNPSLPQRVVDRAYEADPEFASAEYGGLWRTDIEALFRREAVEACVEPERYELPYVSTESYYAFTDPSGGSADSFTLGIAASRYNIEDGSTKGVLVALREFKPPFSPDAVVQDMANTLRGYHLSTVTGDRYGGEFPRERFEDYGVNYITSEKTKSDIYKDVAPLINAKRVELLDHPRMIAQICALERRTARSGKDSIDHPPGQHDDIANAACGALLLAAGQFLDPRLAACIVPDDECPPLIWDEEHERFIH